MRTVLTGPSKVDKPSGHAADLLFGDDFRATELTIRRIKIFLDRIAGFDCALHNCDYVFCMEEAWNFGPEVLQVVMRISFLDNGGMSEAKEKIRCPHDWLCHKSAQDVGESEVHMTWKIHQSEQLSAKGGILGIKWANSAFSENNWLTRLEEHRVIKDEPVNSIDIRVTICKCLPHANPYELAIWIMRQCRTLTKLPQWKSARPDKLIAEEPIDVEKTAVWCRKEEVAVEGLETPVSHWQIVIVRVDDQFSSLLNRMQVTDCLSTVMIPRQES